MAVAELPDRVPAGQGSGGQFTRTDRPELEIDLVELIDQVETWRTPTQFMTPAPVRYDRQGRPLCDRCEALATGWENPLRSTPGQPPDAPAALYLCRECEGKRGFAPNTFGGNITEQHLRDSVVAAILAPDSGYESIDDHVHEWRRTGGPTMDSLPPIESWDCECGARGSGYEGNVTLVLGWRK